MDKITINSLFARLEKICCQLNQLLEAANNSNPIGNSCTNPSNVVLCELPQILDAINKKKDFEPLVLCDITNGNPIIVTYTFDDSGELSIEKKDIDGNIFTGQIGKCPTKNYGITSKEWFCINGTDNIAREDIVNLDDNSPIASLWRDMAGNIIPAPAIGTYTAGICNIEICQPSISSAYANNLSTLQTFHNFSITKPKCCEVQITTSIGNFILNKEISFYSSSDFNCPISISEVSVISGNCTLDKIYIIGNKLK